jgi:DNA-binding GntR family transcriptional regulator
MNKKTPIPLEVAANRADETYLRLKEELFNFYLLPGDYFSENEIAARMEVSRTPVREALFRLQREGYVRVMPRVGWQVRPLDFDKFDQLYEIRILLEEFSLQRLVRKENISSITMLMTTWCCLPDERESDAKAIWLQDEQFHAGLVETGGNAEMSRIHQDVMDRLRIIRRLDFTKSQRVNATYQEHAAILEQIQRGRISEAQRLLRSHIEASRLEVRKITLSMLYEARLKKQGVLNRCVFKK